MTRSNRSDPPEPETKEAILPNTSGEWTKHVFHESKRVELDSLKSPATYIFLFRCLKTGAIRQWGRE